MKIALITGSYKGLGLVIATRLANEKGMKVILSGRDLAKVEASRDQLVKAGLQADAIGLDVDSDTSVRAAFAEIEKRHGRLDVLVNNAGVNPTMDPSEAGLATIRTEIFNATLQTNATAALRVLQGALPLLKKTGSARIVNVSTEMASLAGIPADYYPAAISYRVSKVALNAIVVLAAKELKGTDILINAYSPGWLKTDMGGPNAPFTAEEGAETALYLATLPEGGPSGRFFAEMRKFGGPVELSW